MRRLTDRVADFIVETFHTSEWDAEAGEGVTDERVIFLTKPLFLSFIDGGKNGSADYSFFHVDRDTKEHFLYSALLYLDDGSGEDFAGGELVFGAKRRPFQVSPRAGKLARFVKPLSVTGRGSCCPGRMTAEVPMNGKVKGKTCMFLGSF